MRVGVQGRSRWGGRGREDGGSAQGRPRVSGQAAEAAWRTWGGEGHSQGHGHWVTEAGWPVCGGRGLDVS